MAPTRKARSLNGRFSSEIYPDRDFANPSKTKPRKKKLSDKLGAQWSKGELERFYEAYRRFGKDWKKVATVVCNRSVEMVEALYNTNRAYLSLPEGTASVIGLIAMMTDHYNVLGGTDSDQGSDDISRVPQKSQTHIQAQVQQRNSTQETLFPSMLISNQRPPTRKRTPRYHVAHSFDKANIQNYPPPNKKARRSDSDANDDHGVLALAQGIQREGSPRVSQTPYRSTLLKKPSSVENGERRCSQVGASRSMPRDASICKDRMTCGKGNRRHDKEAYVKDTSSLMDIEGVGTVEVFRKGKKFYKKEVTVEVVGNNHSDDSREACSGTEVVPRDNDLKGKDVREVSNIKAGKCSKQVQRKRSTRLNYGDESSALDALHTLANLSTLMLSTSTVESDSSVQLKEERTMANMGEKPSIPEATFTSHLIHKVHNPSTQNVPTTVSRVTSQSPKFEKNPSTNVKVDPVIKQQPQYRSAGKRKRKPLVSKELVKVEKQSVVEERQSDQISAESKQWKSVKPSEDSSISDEKKIESKLAVSTVSAMVPMSWRTKHKIALKKTMTSRVNSKDNQPGNRPCDFFSKKENPLSAREKLSHRLSSPLACRWCTFEWFYSAIDYPWFSKKEFIDYISHVGLGHAIKLTGTEWSVIKSSLGKPRRFSEHFLTEEREKLNQYRESVRKHYTELHTGVRERNPTDLAHPLSVGKRVLAVHPRTREIHDGKILTVDYDKCNVLFDRAELGVEFVMDIECMPLSSLDYMPKALSRQNVSVDNLSLISNESSLTGRLNSGGSRPLSRSHQLENPVELNQAKALANSRVRTEAAYNQSCVKTHIQNKESDLHGISDVKYALDKKDSSPYHNRRRPQTNCPPVRSNPSFNSNFLGRLDSSRDRFFVSQESQSAVNEIVNGSRLKARDMVDAAIKVLSSIKDGENVYNMIGDALDFVDQHQVASDSRIQAVRSHEQANGSLNDFMRADDVLSGSKTMNTSTTLYDRTRSDLITSCVATLLMIQRCTERQYPPSDVSQIIDSAVTGLHPRCPQNMPIYRELQMCMGIIKTQMLGLVPT